MRSSDEGLEALRTYVDALKLMAEIIAKAAELEEMHGKSLVEIAKDALTPASLLRIAEKTPPEVFARFTTLLLKLSILSPQLANVMQLPPQDKKRLATELSEAAEELSKVIESITKYLGEQP